MTWSDRIGTVGVWRGYRDVDGALAEVIEGLGYGTVWQGGSPTSDLRAAEELLDATSALVVATGVVNIWKSDAAELADAYHRITARHPGRLLLGIGSGHREATPHRVRPLEAMAAYLDVLDEREVPTTDRVLSALGPKMTELASTRSAGTHPYLTVPAQTAQSRASLGADALVAPELTVVHETNESAAREQARTFLEHYLTMENYTTTMQRAGFTAEDVHGRGSDRLVDAIVVHGSSTRLAEGVRAHLTAGADHVCIQVQPAAGDVVRALTELSEELNLDPGEARAKVRSDGLRRG